MKSQGIFPKQAHVKIPTGLFEEEHGRKGFFGRVSHLYHTQPPTSWTNIEGDPLVSQLPNCFKDATNLGWQNILFNQDVIVSIGVLSKTLEYFERNAEFDELFFIHQGDGHFETSYGDLSFQTGDYIIMPKGTTYRAHTDKTVSVLKIESKSEFEQPSRGILGPNALYDQTVIVTPELQAKKNKIHSNNTVHIKRCGKITKVTYPHYPITTAGWKGDLYPWKLSIYDICPVMSHRYHIPPSGHTTFVANAFVVCSFVARPLEDSAHEVLKVPFYHANIDYDEVIFYHKGDFFSRDNIGPGCFTFHPCGIHHGPHPKAFAGANAKTHTDEFAVMIDTRNPLEKSDFFRMHENKDYWKSWLVGEKK